MDSVLVVLLSFLAVGGAPALPTDLPPPPIQEEYERIVVPFPTSRIAGMFGTIWQFDAWVFNASPDRLTLSIGRPVCSIMCEGGRQSVGPGLSRIEFGRSPGGTNNGPILFTNKQQSEHLTFHIRLSLETANGGVEPITEIPVVRENEFRSAPIELLDLPNDDERRVTLRIYDLSARAGTLATIRIYPFYGGPLRAVSDGPPVAERVVSLDEGVVLDDPDFPPYTGYTQIALSDMLPIGAASPDRVRIEVISPTPNAMLWAFASITDNVTQRVSLVTPQ